MSNNIEVLRKKVIDMFHEKDLFKKCTEEFGYFFDKDTGDNDCYKIMVDRFNAMDKEELQAILDNLESADFSIEEAILNTNNIVNQYKASVEKLSKMTREQKESFDKQMQLELSDFMSYFIKKYMGQNVSAQAISESLPVRFIVGIEWFGAEEWRNAVDKQRKDGKTFH